MVLDSVICCVDILAVRYNTITQQKECLLVERGSEPVKGVWWLPGNVFVFFEEERGIGYSLEHVFLPCAYSNHAFFKILFNQPYG
jgi:ADP-ribose pyrophosphatase YjhB (NUDIX family)